MSSLSFVKASSANYDIYYHLSQSRLEGYLFLPQTWNTQLWGIYCYDNNSLVGGWVGKKRISNKFLSLLYQEIVFDSGPVIYPDCVTDALSLSQQIVNNCLLMAKRDNICALQISHWIREYQSFNNRCFEPCKYATFLINLLDDYSDKYEYAQKYTIRKAIKNDVSFDVFVGDSAVELLPDFQRLRKITQQRAIKNNIKATMTLKSETYFKDLLLHYDTFLAVCRLSDKTIASMGLLLKTGKTLYYLYAGSDLSLDRKFGCSTYMTGKFIDYAKTIGCSFVDLGGCPVSPSAEDPAYGVFKFKQSFGGDYKEFIGGEFIIKSRKVNFIKFLKSNRKLMRIISQKF